MTGTAESRRLQYGDEDDISMLSIGISSGKVIRCIFTNASPAVIIVEESRGYYIIR
jgi:hypothetical protein